MEESTGKWYHGDFASEMTFYFDSTDLTFTLSSSENLITFTEPCYGCATIALRNWEQLQVIGNSAFWPLVAAGAPYYISDIEGRKVVSAGKVCDDVIVYECYQRLIDGVYILRLGGGLFGRLTGYPYPTANWTGCGVQGTDRDQLIFRISGGNCIPLQVHRYSGRCDKPQPLNFRAFSSTAAPTGGGTLSPTQSTFGKPYVKGQMYAFDTELEGLSDPLDYNAYRDIELEIEDLDEEKSTKFLQY